MSSAIRLFQGRFGRVALLDMTAPLVEHAHHHCHVLLKAGGSDSAFLIRGERQPLTDITAVLVNAWEPHAYQHDLPPGQDTLILALYIEPSWLAEIQQSLTLSGHPRFFPRNCVEINSNGNLSPCRDYHDYVVGNVKDHTITDLWNNEPYARFRSSLHTEGLMPVCTRCCGLMGY